MSTQKASITAEDIELLKVKIREIYLSDSRPWVIGYSGGKDSSSSTRESSLMKRPVHRVVFLLLGATMCACAVALFLTISILAVALSHLQLEKMLVLSGFSLSLFLLHLASEK